MTPVAVERAQALLRHVRYLGAPQNQFYLNLTKPEAFELLPWLRETWALSPQFDIDQLDFDIAHARAVDNPWIVLAHFDLYGFTLIPSSELH